jgi:SAM-dependent methyltransferase
VYDRIGTEPTPEQALAGSAVYTPEWLAEYDAVVLENVCRRVWRCGPAVMLRWYERNIGERHVDFGPGTGYFLDNCRYGFTRPQIALVDLNPAVLAEAASRLRRFRPVTYQRDVLSKFELGDEKFHSAGLNFLLHCLPGEMARKAQVLDHAREHVVPGGRIFGSTVLMEGVRHNRVARRLLETLNENGTFSNQGDSLDGLEAEIASRFTEHRVVVHGSVALFEARV